MATAAFEVIGGFEFLVPVLISFDFAFALLSQTNDEMATTRIARVCCCTQRYVEFLEFEFSDGSVASAGTLGGQRNELILEPDEFITELWGRHGSVLNCIGVFTNKERMWGPWGWVAGKPFELTAPRDEVLAGVTVSEASYCGAVVVKSVEPSWGYLPGSGKWSSRAVAVYRKRVATVAASLESSCREVAAFTASRDASKGLASAKAKAEETGVLVRELLSTEAPQGCGEIRLQLERVASSLATLNDVIAAYEGDEDRGPLFRPTSGDVCDLGATAFLIVSECDKSLVLSVEDGQLASGTKIVAAPHVAGDDSHQRFVFDEKGRIRAKKSGLVIGIASDESTGVIQAFVDNSLRQTWTYCTQDHTLRLGRGDSCLQLCQSRDVGTLRDTIVAHPSRDLSQRWLFCR